MALPVDRLEFDVTDAMDLMYRTGWFDFVYSINAFEHIPDPARALAEVGRVLRSGGYAYLSFDPAWTADTGSHFQHRVSEPWAHVLLDDEFASRTSERCRVLGDRRLSGRNESAVPVGL